MTTDWKYYIMDDLGRTARVVNGVVQYLGTPAPIPESPDGWDDISLRWERNLTRYGPMRNFSLPLGFVFDSAHILRDGLYKSNVDRKLYLLLQRRVLELDEFYFKDYYKFFYKGQFDLSTLEDFQDEERVEVNLLEGGLWSTLAAKEDAEVFIPFDDDAINIRYDGILLTEKATWLIYEQKVNLLVGTQAYIGTSYINKEGQAVGVAYFDQQPNVAAGSGAPSGDNYLFRVSQDITGMTFEVPLVFTSISQPSSPTFQVILKTNTNRVIALTPVLINGTTNYMATATFNAVANEQFYLFQTGLSTLVNYGESQITLSFQSKKSDSYVKAFTALMLGRKLVEKMTGNANDFYSDLLTESTYAFTSGDGIRSIPKAGIKTTFKKFCQAINVYHMTGYGVENNKIRIEKRSHFWQYGNPIDCGIPKNLKISPAKEYFFTSLRIGHAEPTVDDVNGKSAFNGQSVYDSPMKTDTKEMTITTEYKADPFEQEIIRINFDGKTTTDAQQDNTVFVVDVKDRGDSLAGYIQFIAPNLVLVDPNIKIIPGQIFTTSSAINPGPFTVVDSGTALGIQIVSVIEPVISEPSGPGIIFFTGGAVYDLRRDIIPTAGVPSPTSVFNVSLLPAFLVRVHGGWLRGALEGYPGESLVFNTATRITDFEANGIKATDNIPIDLLDPAMFSPHILKYNTEVPVSIVESLDANPNRSFAGTARKGYFEGFGLGAGVQPHTLQEQEFTLLAAPTFDIKKFI